MRKLSRRIAACAVSALVLSSGSAFADAIIDNGTIQLGVDDLGQLNVPGGDPSSGTGTSTVGLRYLPNNTEATAPGCLCEGWGAAIEGTGITGFANNSSGSGGLTQESFVSDASSATVVTTIGSSLRVTHEYTPSAETDFLYEVNVSVENISGGDLGNLLYRRVMDWDVEPTAFAEFVTIDGTAEASAVAFASDDGFASSNPLSGLSSLLFTGDATDSGPADHGALFQFNFGALGLGEIFEFQTFYGAAPTEREALLALSAVGAEVFSFGQASTDADGLGGPGLQTFIFGFAGVGGIVVGEIPAPASLLLFGAGLMGLAGLRRRKA